MEASFTVAFLQTSELIIPQQEHRMPGLGENGDAQMEVDLSLAKAARCATWRRLRLDSQGSQARASVMRASTEFKGSGSLRPTGSSNGTPRN